MILRHPRQVSALCSLLNEDVVAVVSISTSTKTGMEADVLHAHNVPLISTIATNTYLKTPDRPGLVLMSPMDKYQSR